jgi:clan AA aspartic protease
MAREEGSVNTRQEAWLRVHTIRGETFDCLIDTGFNGGLVLPRSEAARLNLTILGRVPIIGVGRAKLIADIAELEVEWLGGKRAIEVIITDGDESLLGTELLDGTQLLVNYIAYTVIVSDEAN